MNNAPLVVSFFFGAAAVFLFIAARFVATGEPAMRHFGRGLGLYALSFFGTGIVVALRPAEPAFPIDLTMLPFVAGSLSLLAAALESWPERRRIPAYAGATLYLLALILLRQTLFPSAPAFSAQGLIYFHAQPPILLLYLGLLAGAVLPALHVVSGRIKDTDVATLTRVAFQAIVLGFVVMLVSEDDTLQLLNGTLLALPLLALLITYARRRPA